jgi:hypothetical protein
MIEEATRHIFQELPSRPSFTPEFRLLLDCSLIPLASQESRYSARVAKLCSAADDEAIKWDIFMGLVDRHRVPALVRTTLNRYASKYVPEAIVAQLKVRETQSRLQALRHACELAHLGKQFFRKDIELLPFKGPTLSVDLYGDPGLRHSKDLDVMVKTADLDRADQVMLEEGYKRTFPNFDPLPRQTRTLQSAYQHYEYLHPQRLVNVELHWRLDLWTPEQISELWAQSLPMEWCGAGFRRLDEKMTLLLLCDHGSHHLWFRIKWLSDVAAMLSRLSGTNSALLIEMSERFDLRRSLAQATLLVHRLYEIPIAEPLLAWSKREKKAVSLADQAYEAIMMSMEDFNKPSFSTNCRRHAYFLGLKTRLPYRYFLQRMLVDSETWELLPLPDKLYWLCYPLRLAVWFRRHFLEHR